MAKDNDNLDENLDESKGKSGKKRLIIILALVLLLLALGGGYLGYAYLKNLPPFEPSGPTPEEIAKAKMEKQASMQEQLKEHFISFDSAFTFNLVDAKGRKHMMQIEIVLMTTGPENQDLLKKHLPLAGSVISEIASTQNYEELISPMGRQNLKDLLLEAVRSRLAGATNKNIVDRVLFTNFVLQ